MSKYENSTISYEGTWNTVIANNFIRNNTISSQARFIYIVLKTFINYKSKVAFPSLPHIENLVGLSKNTIIKYLKELEKRGYIVKSQPKSKKGKFKNNNYILYESPVTHSPTPKNCDTEVTHSPTPNFTDSVKLNPRGIPYFLEESKKEEEKRNPPPNFLLRKLKEYNITDKQIITIFNNSTEDNIEIQIEVLEYYLLNKVKIPNIPKKLFAMIRDNDVKPEGFISKKDKVNLEQKNKSELELKKNKIIELELKENKEIKQKFENRKKEFNAKKYDNFWNSIKKQLPEISLYTDMIFIQNMKKNKITINVPNTFVKQRLIKKSSYISKVIEKIKNIKYKIIFNSEGGDNNE